jgi:hypothetical protein
LVVDECAAGGDAGSVPKLVHAAPRAAGRLCAILRTFPYGSLADATGQRTTSVLLRACTS